METIKIEHMSDPAGDPVPTTEESWRTPAREILVRKHFIRSEDELLTAAEKYNTVYWPFGSNFEPDGKEKEEGQPYVFVNYQDEQGEYRTVACTRAVVWIMNDRGVTVDKISATH